jgi:hypothetical protein
MPWYVDRSNQKPGTAIFNLYMISALAVTISLPLCVWAPGHHTGQHCNNLLFLFLNELLGILPGSEWVCWGRASHALQASSGWLEAGASPALHDWTGMNCTCKAAALPNPHPHLHTQIILLHGHWSLTIVNAEPFSAVRGREGWRIATEPMHCASEMKQGGHSQPAE